MNTVLEQDPESRTCVGFPIILQFLDAWLCTVPDAKELPERLVDSLTAWAVDLNPVSSVPMVRGQGILRQRGDRGRHSENHFPAQFRILG